jgi:hypothetical protein
MKHLFSMLLALSILAPQDQDLPPEFHKLPEPLRARATLIITGTYAQGRSPCIFMPDGSRVWALESWFRIRKVYRGQVGGKSVSIKRRVSAKTEDAGVKLEVGREYLVLLRPSEESMKAIRAGEYVPAWEALHDEEILAVVELK